MIFERNLLAGFLVHSRLSRRQVTCSPPSPVRRSTALGKVLGTTHCSFAVLSVDARPGPCHRNGGPRNNLGYLALPHSTYIPDWYAIACLAVDLAFGAYVAARVPAYQRASHSNTEN